MAQLSAYGSAGHVQYASWWIRLVAIIIDNVIVGIASFIVSLVFGFVLGLGLGLSGSTPGSNADSILSLMGDIIGLVIWAGYFTYYWSEGATPGMRLFRIAIVDANSGIPIGFSRAFIRVLGYIVSAIVCYVGLIWAAFDGRHQGWHDKLANSIVIQG